jgi:hypothetical protein
MLHVRAMTAMASCQKCVVETLVGHLGALGELVLVTGVEGVVALVHHGRETGEQDSSSRGDTTDSRERVHDEDEFLVFG